MRSGYIIRCLLSPQSSVSIVAATSNNRMTTTRNKNSLRFNVRLKRVSGVAHPRLYQFVRVDVCAMCVM